MLWATSVTFAAPVAARIASIFAASCSTKMLDRRLRRAVGQACTRGRCPRPRCAAAPPCHTPALHRTPCSSSTGARAGRAGGSCIAHHSKAMRGCDLAIATASPTIEAQRGARADPALRRPGRAIDPRQREREGRASQVERDVDRRRDRRRANPARRRATAASTAHDDVDRDGAAIGDEQRHRGDHERRSCKEVQAVAACPPSNEKARHAGRFVRRADVRRAVAARRAPTATSKQHRQTQGPPCRASGSECAAQRLLRGLRAGSVRAETRQQHLASRAVVIDEELRGRRRRRRCRADISVGADQHRPRRRRRRRERAVLVTDERSAERPEKRGCLLERIKRCAAVGDETELARGARRRQREVEVGIAAARGSR